MSQPKRNDPFDALNDSEFDAHVAKLLDKPVSSVTVSLRIPALLLERLKRAAGRADLPYQTFTKRLLEIALDRLERMDPLQLTAPQDMAEASRWFQTQKPRLITWAAATLAARLNGHVLEGSARGAVQAVIEFSTNGTDGTAGVLLVEKAQDVTLANFENAFISLGCERGYVIGFVLPSAARQADANSHHIYYEGLQDLLTAAIGRKAS